MNGDSPSIQQHETARLIELFNHQRSVLFRETDRVFAGLMVFQWLGGIATALIVSPRTWIGDTFTVHYHVWAAVVVGAVISSLPLFLAINRPGEAMTRHVIAIAQIAWSALLIHLSGGRIETHFHIFGSLAILSFYRDWRVLVTASVVVAADHFLRGVWWPQSVFGVLVASPYRWLEHTAWVAFEDIFLISSCLRGVRETREICLRRANLEATNARIEHQVSERTEQLYEQKRKVERANRELCKNATQLAKSNARLAEEIDERIRAEAERSAIQDRFIAASRRVGMAEVATGVLHNVGNVLNSINVSANLLLERVETCETASLAKSSEVICQHRANLATFLTSDSRGKHFPELFQELTSSLSRRQQQQANELRELMRHIEHVKEIVCMQQDYAIERGYLEPVTVGDLVDDARKLNDAGLLRHGVTFIREVETDMLIVTDKHKVLQILVNLISNGKYAVSACDRQDKQLTLVASAEQDHVCIQVRDNGIGIPRENLTKIFAHGFTTRADGHGFGLHSAALAAQELGGSLGVDSDGLGHGAVFTLRLPKNQSTAETDFPQTSSHNPQASML